MLQKEDKDGIIAFLRERLQKIQQIAYRCSNDIYDGYADIGNLAETALIDTTW